MSERKLNDEQIAQLDKVFVAFRAWGDSWSGEWPGDRDSNLFDEVHKLQELLRPPKTYLIRWANNQFGTEPWTTSELKRFGADSFGAIWEWDNGTVGEPITGEALRELLEGEQ